MLSSPSSVGMFEFLLIRNGFDLGIIIRTVTHTILKIDSGYKTKILKIMDILSEEILYPPCLPHQATLMVGLTTDKPFGLSFLPLLIPADCSRPEEDQIEAPDQQITQKRRPDQLVSSPYRRASGVYQAYYRKEGQSSY